MINKIRLIYKVLFSSKVRFLFRRIIKFIIYRFRFFKLKFILSKKDNVNLILGAALTSEKNWISTNEEWLDITNYFHWKRLFGERSRIKRAVAEHVFEHLTKDEMRTALNLVYRYLIKGGTLRIAVPDGNNPNKEYRDHTGINGIGADASDHKQFITYEFLKSELENCGFKCFLREGYKSNQELLNDPLPKELGNIIRSRRNSKNTHSKTGWDFIDSNSSLIIDAYK